MQAILFVGYLALMIAQGMAFFEGMDVWLDSPGLAALVVFVICLFLGPVGSLFVAVVAFVGATDGWRWEWWQALLLVAPGLVLSIAFALVSGTVGMLGALFARRAA